MNNQNRIQWQVHLFPISVTYVAYFKYTYIEKVHRIETK